MMTLIQVSLQNSLYGLQWSIPFRLFSLRLLHFTHHITLQMYSSGLAENQLVHQIDVPVFSSAISHSELPLLCVSKCLPFCSLASFLQLQPRLANPKSYEGFPVDTYAKASVMTAILDH